MAIGQGSAAFFKNYPQGGYVTSLQYWEENTEKNDAPMAAQAYPGLGGTRLDIPIPNVGLLASVKLLFVGQLNIAGGNATTSYRWPWNIVRNLSVSVNGQTGLTNGSGLDLRAHRNRVYRNPVEAVSAAPGTDAKCNPFAGTVLTPGNYSVVLMFEVPIVHDFSSLAGLLFAQSDANDFGISITPEQAANLFTAGSGFASLTGSFYPTLKFFDIPVIDGQGNQQGGPVLPPMNWLHALVARDVPVLGAGEQDIPLLKESGQLLAIYDYIDNGSNVQLNPATSYDQVRLEYGINRKPEVFSGPIGQGALTLLEENQENYNGLLLPGYKVFDFEADNPDRDVVYPTGVSALQLVNVITAAAAAPAGSKNRVVTETLYSAL
jgi:hypothetical protein